MGRWKFADIVEAHRQIAEFRKVWPYWAWLWGIELSAFALGFGWFFCARDWFGVPVAAVLLSWPVPILAC